jgi:hypothetical protein
MMNDADQVAAEFLAQVPEASRERAERALRIVFQAVEQGSIFNVDFQSVKYSLNSAAEHAWKAATDHFWVGKAGKLDADAKTNEALNALHWACLLSGARDAIAISKKLAKVKVQHPMVDAMRAVVSRVLPVALVLEDLKSKVVKGRKPNPEAQARKAALAANAMPTATCACCFHEQAVLPNGNIHDHGYQIPRQWNKTASCYGRQFRPLEVSDDGLKFMVKLLKMTVANLEGAVERARTSTSITRRSYSGNEVTYTPTSKEWAQVLAGAIAEAEQELRSAQSDLKTFKKALADWKPAAKAGSSSRSRSVSPRPKS